MIARLSTAVILASLAFGQPLFSAPAEGNGGSAVSANATPDSFDEIVSLQIRINASNKMTLVRQRVVSGHWSDNRSVPVGTRLYYEVLDDSGNVVSKGYRKDPRIMMASNNVDFLLSAPYNSTCASVNVYSVDYETGGTGGYTRNYKLMGSFDIRNERNVAVR